MNKKAIHESLINKLKARSSKLFEDVNNEIWDMTPEEPVVEEEPAAAEQDFNIEIDGEPTEEACKEDEEPQISALDAILNGK